MKRLLIVAMIATSIGAVASASAGCSEENQGGSVGPYDTVGVDYQDLEIRAWTYGNFATGPTSVCSDGTMNTAGPYGDFEVKRNGIVVCTSTDPAFRVTADPFGFGASIPGTGDDCEVAISLDGIVATPGVNPADHGADTSGGNVALLRKDAPVKEFGEGGTDPSFVRLGDETIEIPNGTMGFFTKGVRAQSESSG